MRMFLIIAFLLFHFNILHEIKKIILVNQTYVKD